MEDSVDSLSGLVASRNSGEQEETSIMMGTESKGSEWSDEKHSLYLKSMETTFVNQLYKSLDLSGWHSRKNDPSGFNKSSKQKQTSVRAPSGQFKVLRDGHWSNINFRKNESETDQEEESGFLANPWIHHYRCSGKQATRRSPASCPKGPSGSALNQYPMHNFQLSRQDSEGDNSEMSGQNFNNEDLEEEKPDSINETKRINASADIVFSTDQVAPCCSNGSPPETEHTP